MPNNYPPQYRTPSNGLGIAGFIVSLVGIVGSCGLLCPVGLLMSIIAMRREPRGFAIAGLIIGLLGSLWIFIALGFIILTGGVVAAAVALGIAAWTPPIPRGRTGSPGKMRAAGPQRTRVRASSR